MTTTRAGRWAAQKARRKQWQVIERLRWHLLTGLAIGWTGAALITGLVPSERFAGFLGGATATATLGLLAYLVAQESGTVHTMAGSDAERMTSEGLRRAHRRGWVVRDQIYLRGGDVDHLMIGGEVAYVVETKWSATSWLGDRGAERIDIACADLRRRKKLATSFLAHNLHHPVEVRSILVLWGGGQGDVVPNGPPDVQVLRGRHVRRWADGLPDAGLANPRPMARSIDAFLASADERRHEGDAVDGGWYIRRGPVATVGEVLWIAFAAYTGMVATVLAVGAHVLGGLAFAFVLVVGGLALAPKTSWRWRLRALAGGAASTLVIAAVFVTGALVL